MEFQLLSLEAYGQARLAFAPCFFALPAYLAQTQETVHIFAIISREGIEGIAPFVIRNGIACSPPRATFGGWYGNNLPAEVQQGFWDWAKKTLQSLEATQIQLKLAPDFTLPAVGLPALPADLNYHIDLAHDFVGKLHSSEKRRLKKARSVGLVGEHWANPDLPAVYGFIAEARQRKGFPMTLSWEAFQAMFVLFPAYYDVFAVRSPAQEIVALTVTVKIDSQTFYNFYPADSEAWLAYSPAVLLTEFAADWAKANGFAVLDLGIATENGIRNEGLIRFKRNLGAIETQKHTLFGYL